MVGFDNKKYLEIQSEKIKERFNFKKCDLELSAQYLNFGSDNTDLTSRRRWNYVNVIIHKLNLPL